MQLEHHVARQDPGTFRLVDLGLEENHALAKRAGEPLLLGGRHLLHLRPVLHELGIGIPEQLHGPIGQVLNDRTLDGEPPGVADHPAEHPAEHVAPALVRGKDTVGDQERCGPAVLRDDLE